MTELTDKIYFADKDIFKIIESEFELIDQKNWYRLYKNKTNDSFWRLDEFDKYQEQFFVILESSEKWFEFNDKTLRIELLKRSRGLSKEKCIWKDCENNALNKIAYCENHAYNEMGIRK